MKTKNSRRRPGRPTREEDLERILAKTDWDEVFEKMALLDARRDAKLASQLRPLARFEN